MGWNSVSAKPVGADSGLQRLLDEGYEVEVYQHHMLVHSVPYVTSQREVARGTMICLYIKNAGAVLPPNAQGDNHQVWWVGQFPCRKDGNFLTELCAETRPQQYPVFEGCTAQHQFSNKPEEFSLSGYPNHYEKIVHYVQMIQAHASALEPNADARTGNVLPQRDAASVFKYPDTASARAEIMVTAARLKLRRVAIVGLGGTGSYVLDQVAKTMVEEIHLFDGDIFKQHNAFRAPGAATWDELCQKMPKVEYFAQRYEPMRRGLVQRPHFLDDSNIAELAGFDFVFVCVDKGPARGLICNYLVAQGIPFVDVGMDVVMDAETFELDGTCRVTTGTKEKNDHLEKTLPVHDDSADALYRQNIQISDLNALNAQLAVIKWKQLFGFYEDVSKSHHTTYTVALQALTRAEAGPGEDYADS